MIETKRAQHVVVRFIELAKQPLSVTKWFHLKDTMVYVQSSTKQPKAYYIQIFFLFLGFVFYWYFSVPRMIRGKGCNRYMSARNSDISIPDSIEKVAYSITNLCTAPIVFSFRSVFLMTMNWFYSAYACQVC